MIGPTIVLEKCTTEPRSRCLSTCDLNRKSGCRFSSRGWGGDDKDGYYQESGEDCPLNNMPLRRGEEYYVGKRHIRTWNKEDKMDPRELGIIPDKFTVTRRDGKDGPGQSHEGNRLFVLDLTADPHALPAIKAYAESCKDEYPVLAKELLKVVKRIEEDTRVSRK